MRKWPHGLALVLIAIGSVASYFALQIIAALVAFSIYGSGEIFSAKTINVSALFVVGQLMVVSYLFYSRVWIKKTPALLLALLIPAGLFLALDGSSLLSDK
jgi:hypothetical protein